MAALFACTRCNSRHPFEELSQGQQLCKDCRGSYPIVKCTYCRTEFQQENKGNTTTICKKCEQNVKLYGKPTACEYCNIIAAFIGSKCQRCTNSEKKYGPPLTCEQCKQRCAYDRKDDSRKKVDGKLLCWLCTLSYKRALAKAKQNNPIRHTSVSLQKSSSHHRSGSQNHKHSISHSHKNPEHRKKQKLDSSKSANANGTLPSNDSALMDPNSSDHVVAVTQLREQIALLQKQLGQKDQQLLAKDIQMAELKAQHSGIEKELRLKIQTIQKQHSEQLEELQIKTRTLQKQVATLSKANKKVNADSPSTT
ncbi:protein FAM76A [Centruroides vittatus]|uniref:protein FAM76A n=1 Tax=Centruroides vittatus TaxID=120091 RepID=UPI0035107A8E